MILVTFAVPQESRAFIARLHHAAMLGPALVGNLGREEVAVVHTGMGAAAARAAVDRALAELRPAFVIGSGFAGALDPALAVGTLVTCGVARLVSVSAPLDTPEAKARLRATTGADAVDMETAAISAACTAAHTPLLVLRVISDAADEALPLPSGIAYDTAQQRIRPLAILRHLQQHPEAIAPLVRFVQRLPMLQRVLADAIEAAIASPRH